MISIHALREEGDEEFLAIPSDLYDFYPRPPRGGRRFKRRQDVKLTLFLSTPSARRATRQAFQVQKYYEISIHALREEGDQKQQKQRRLKSISIHALREEGDRV